MKNRDSGLLVSNGRHIVLWKPRDKHLLGYVKRRGNTAAKVAVNNKEGLGQILQKEF